MILQREEAFMALHIDTQSYFASQIKTNTVLNADSTKNTIQFCEKTTLGIIIVDA